MRQYLRQRQKGGTYFFTLATAERGPQGILVREIEALRNAFSLVQVQRPWTIDAAVVLPDHLHLVVTLPSDDDDFSTRIRLIKSAFSKQIRRDERISPSRIRKGERGIWQRRFWEHLVRDDDDFRRCVEYVHFNPVKHGYAKCPIDWPHSSFRKWVDRGDYDENWGATD